MIRIELGAPGRAQVIGSLASDSVQAVLDAVQSGIAALDLSEVDKADDTAVRVLAAIPPERCTLVSCPRWLELWLDRVRAAGR